MQTDRHLVNALLTKYHSITYTEGGATGLSLNCYSMFGGQQCETVTQVNVPVSFLTQTK